MSQPKPWQLQFVFADSPQGNGDEDVVDGSTTEAALVHTANGSQQAESATSPATDAGRLLERVAASENLALALEKVVSNQGAPGVDGQTVQLVAKHAGRLLPMLRDALLSETFIPGDIRRVWIPKPGGGQRGLGIPNVIDRWVQQAVLQILEPLYEPTFHDGSHGFRPGRGSRTAIEQSVRYVNDGRRYTVDIDLEKFGSPAPLVEA
ncbi:MAG: maturase [Gemmatimonadetes bacterium]|nr:maturase [Gemmatimonadota bacterium]